MNEFLNNFFFGYYPYIAGTVFLAGSVVRFDMSQYTWKTNSSQIMDSSPRFRLANNMFHIGMIFLFFGHLIGDEVLILVARLMRSSFRSHDRVFRFGGEEFVVVLRCADHASAYAALERFRRNMEAYDFPQVGQKTASVGFTQILPGDSPSAACERADQAVYHAKRNGRNQVCSESDLVDRGLLKADVKVGDIELF